MALQRFTPPYPTKYRGIEDLAPAEMQEFAIELVRRLDTNWHDFTVAAQANLIADPEVLPVQEDGASAPAAFGSATTKDAEEAMLMAIMWR